MIFIVFFAISTYKPRKTSPTFSLQHVRISKTTSLFADTSKQGRCLFKEGSTATQQPISQTNTENYLDTFTENFPPIYAILVRSVLHIYTERVYNYASTYQQPQAPSSLSTPSATRVNKHRRPCEQTIEVDVHKGSHTCSHGWKHLCTHTFPCSLLPLLHLAYICRNASVTMHHLLVK